jgi:hypothetical protein
MRKADTHSTPDMPSSSIVIRLQSANIQILATPSKRIIAVRLPSLERA